MLDEIIHTADLHALQDIRHIINTLMDTSCSILRWFIAVNILTSLTVLIIYCKCKFTDTFDSTSVQFKSKLLMC